MFTLVSNKVESYRKLKEKIAGKNNRWWYRKKSKLVREQRKMIQINEIINKKERLIII